MLRTRLLHRTYLFYFFLSLHGGLFLYITSSILAQYVPEQYVGALFSLAALLSIPALLFVPRLLSGIGDIRSTLLLCALEVIFLYLFVSGLTVVTAVIAFLLFSVCLRLLSFDADVLLESISADATTGATRGAFLTLGNAALVASPLLVGFILANGTNYFAVFVASVLALAPAFFILTLSFKHFKDPRYRHPEVKKNLLRMWHTPNLRRVFGANFLLRVFYAIMVVYTGLYLHTHLGMPWTGIGIVLTVMLLPFPLIEYPLGRISDTIVGEKELLAAGFIIAGAVTMAIPWLHSTSVLVWSVMLCATRIGAAIVEIMTETYFFKQVDARDAEMIGAYRIVEPCAYILAPAAASLLLRAADIRFIFLILGIVMLAGVYPALRLRDTK